MTKVKSTVRVEGVDENGLRCVVCDPGATFETNREEAEEMVSLGCGVIVEDESDGEEEYTETERKQIEDLAMQAEKALADTVKKADEDLKMQAEAQRKIDEDSKMQAKKAKKADDEL